MVETSYGDKLHQRGVSPLVKNNEPDRKDDKWQDQNRTVNCQAETDDACHSNLENDQAKDDAVADDRPGLSSRVPAVIHCIEELIFVDEAAEDEVQQAEEQYEPRAWQDAIDDTDDEYEDALWKVEAIAEHWRLHKLCVV
jgi:hypothetical protein